VRYSPRLVEHFLHPRNAGLMRDPDGVGEEEHADCGDLTRVYLRVREGRAADVRFQTYGCGPTIAAASAVSELAQGQPVEDLVAIKPADVEAALGGLPDDRRHAADVAAGALRNAALDYLRRRAGGRGPGG
jgi:nitrogen fixation protein NifU and related proteins